MDRYELFFHQMFFISEILSNLYILVPFVLIPAIYLYYKRYRLESFLFFATTLSYPYTLLLKGIFKTSRPDLGSLMFYTPWDIYGFPSGHVVFYVVFWGFLIYLTFRLKKLDTMLRKIVQWAGVYFIVFVGASRLALNVHYLQDIIGGYFFGLIFLIALIYVERVLKRGHNPFTKD